MKWNFKVEVKKISVNAKQKNLDYLLKKSTPADLDYRVSFKRLFLVKQEEFFREDNMD